MLPSFRFLFAATVLSMSMLIFGLGAAALLRAAHQEFASILSRRAPPEIIFAQQSDPGPTLALVRIDTPAVDLEILHTPATDNAEISARSADQPVVLSTAPEPEQPAAEPDKIAGSADGPIPAEQSPPSETAKLETAAAEIPVQAGTPARADAPLPAAETTVAEIVEFTPAAPIDDSTKVAETKIATLGGPAVTIETPRPSKLAPAALQKSAQAKRTVKRRRIAQRARPAPPQPPNPFGTRFGS